jgi:hypothetical protein
VFVKELLATSLTEKGDGLGPGKPSLWFFVGGSVQTMIIPSEIGGTGFIVVSREKITAIAMGQLKE